MVPRKIVKEDWMVPFLSKSMTFLGIGVNDDGQTVYSSLLAATGVFLILHWMIFTIVFANNEACLSTSVSMVASTVNVTVCLITSCYFRTAKKRIHAVRLNISKLLAESVPQNASLFSFIVIWIYGIIYITFSFTYFEDEESVKKLFETLELQISDFCIITISLVSITGYYFVSFLPEKLILLFYSTLCRDIGELYCVLCGEVETLKNDSKEAISSLIGRYEEIYRIVHALDDLYSPVMFLCTLSTGFTLILHVYELCGGNRIGDANFVVLMTSGVLCQFVAFSESCISASRVPDLARKTINEIFERSDSYADNNLREKIYRNYLKCMFEPPRLTGWKTFPINRQLPLTLCRVAITYLMVMYEIQ